MCPCVCPCMCKVLSIDKLCNEFEGSYIIFISVYLILCHFIFILVFIFIFLALGLPPAQGSPSSTAFLRILYSRARVVGVQAIAEALQSPCKHALYGRCKSTQMSHGLLNTYSYRSPWMSTRFLATVADHQKLISFLL